MNRQCLILIVLMILLIPLIGPARAQNAAPGLTIFRDADSLTLYVPGSGPLMLHELAFRVTIDGDTQTYNLADYPAFGPEVVGIGGVPTPLCLRLERADSAGLIPDVCLGITFLSQPLDDADVFWFDAATQTARDVTLLSDTDELGTCGADEALCTLDMPPVTGFVPAVGKPSTEIAFVTRPGSEWQVYVVNVENGELRCLTPDGANDNNPVWSPDGGQIALNSDRGGNKDIYVMDPDGSHARRLTDYDESDEIADWLPDPRGGTGYILFVSSRDGGHDLYVMNADGSDVYRLVDTGYWHLGGRWSPDGRRVAFMSGDESKGYDICLVDSNGDNLWRLSEDETDDYSPAWSPDGKQIAFSSYRREGEWYQSDIFLAVVPDAPPVTAPVLYRLTDHTANDSSPTWSPDGRWIAFVSKRDGDKNLYITSVTGDVLLQVTGHEADDLLPSWSPDGRWIAFVSDRNGVSDVYMIAVPEDLESVGGVLEDTTPPVRLTTDISATAIRLAWRPAP